MLKPQHLHFVSKNNRLLSRFNRQRDKKNYTTLFCYEKRQQICYCARKAERPLITTRIPQLTTPSKQNASTYLDSKYSPSVIEDATLDFAGLARKYKYPVEEHKVHTSDGYILQVHRLPRPQGKPIFLMHGLMDSADTWIIPGTDIGLGYYLYDIGYDVWMGNARGNFYSRQHLEKSAEEKSFWDFSWHEIGYYDLPAMIDYVLESTGEQKLTYFGHSQGTTSFFVMASTRPEYNAKIRLANALAPVAYMINATVPLQLVARKVIHLVTDPAFEIMPRSNTWKFIFQSKIMEQFYEKYMHTYLGAFHEMWNPSRLPAIAAHAASGCSFKQFKHYSHLKDLQRFCQYDYGAEENLKRYGSEEPPSYPLKNITAPVALYYAQNDPLSHVEDVRRLIGELPNVVKDHMYPDKQWNHVTMIWGVNARKLAHEPIAEVLKEHH